MAVWSSIAYVGAGILAAHRVGKGYIAAGMTRALDSSIGLPSRPASASRMPVFEMRK